MSRRQAAIAHRLDEASAARAAADHEAAAKRIATMCGWCSSCGEDVDVAKGRLHGWECPDSTPETRNAPPSGWL